MTFSPDAERPVVIVGLGYVGLPLAQAAVAVGIPVVGFDVSESLVGDLNAGVSHVDDLSDADVAVMLSQGFRASADPAVLGSRRWW
ncbi:hypothetical protein [Nesterenkonia sp. PF2B19]|uniref:hypothetical protein n=1 Tax=Nesterenkonia sp. PF2B19 TaxID=1881858 RepID=UPI000872BB88|nr:hypothetical protein [Nesterenkonia sp. PF2B19]